MDFPEAELLHLKAEVDRLSREVRLARAYADIANLQAAYGYYVDKCRWDDVADLFGQVCSMEINGRGVYLGQARVRQYMYRFGPEAWGKMSTHMQLQPVINVADDGLSAKGRWRAFIMVGQMGENARWGETIYENEYVCEDGVWKISKLHAYQTFYTEYAEGWGKAALPLVPVHADLPPDAPPSENYKVFPDFYLPPYHYKNPVSGR